MKKSHLLLLALPYVVILLGAAMNQAAVHANGGHMPVYFPGGNCSLLGSEDFAHSCMNHATHLKVLCDWLISSRSVSSIGDWMLDFGNDIKIPSLVAACVLIVRHGFGKQ